MNKLSKTAKALDKFVAFAYGVTIVAMAIGILGGIILAVGVAKDAEFLKSNTSNLLSFGRLKLLLAPGVLKEITVGNYGVYLLWMLAAAMVSTPVYCVALLTVRDILNPFIHQQPFHETVAKDLRKLSILVVVNTVLNGLTTVILDIQTRNLYDIHRLFNPTQEFGDRIITASLGSAVIDVTPLFFAGALYLLSKVFLYGQELQQLSDETL